MYEYNMFVNKYYMLFKSNISYEGYVALKDRITQIIDKLLIYDNEKITDIDKTYDFVMYTILKKYHIEEILNGKHDLEIKNMIKYFENKTKKEQQSNFENNEAKKYIFNLLKSIKNVFVPKTDLKVITNRIYTGLTEQGYKDDEITETECDYVIIELLRGNSLDIQYKEDFLKYRKKIEYKVSNIFMRHKLNIIRKSPGNVKYDMSYMYYDSPYCQMNAAFKAALSFYLSQVPLDEVNTFNLDNYINDFITKDMIKTNSISNRKQTRQIEKQVLSEEEKIVIEKLNKMKATVWGIVIGTIVLGSIGYSTIMNYPFEKPKEKNENSSFEESQNLRDRIEQKLNELTYNFEDNTFTPGGR